MDGKFVVCTSNVKLKQCGKEGLVAEAKVLYYSDGSSEIDTMGVEVEPEHLEKLMTNLPVMTFGGKSSADQKPSVKAMGAPPEAKVDMPKEPPKEVSPTEANRAQEMFNRFDRDRNGYLDPAEFKALCSEILGAEVTASSAMFMLQAMDPNSDKKITPSELSAFWPGIKCFLSSRNKSDPSNAVRAPTSAPPEPTKQAEPQQEEPSPSPHVDKKVLGTAAKYMTQLEKDVFHELNIARTQPSVYADIIEEQAKHITGGLLRVPGKIAMCVQEPGAWPEAIEALRKQTPLEPVKRCSLGMYLGGKEHCRDQTRTGAIGHNGKDGSSSSERCKRYGAWSSSCGENISYGHADAQGIMLQLIIDANVPSRGHRVNIYNPMWEVCSVACGGHGMYGSMCVQNFAGSYKENKQKNEARFEKSLRITKKTNGIVDEEPEPEPEPQPARGKAKRPVRRMREVPPEKEEDILKVYIAQDCPRCMAAVKVLEESAVPHEVLDMAEDESYFGAMVRGGFKGGEFQLPVVVTSQGDALWDIEDIDETLRKVVLEEVGAVEECDGGRLSSLMTHSLSPAQASAIDALYDEHASDAGLTKDATDAFLDGLYTALHLETRCDEVQRADIVALFRNHDKDRNGRLSKSELAAYLGSSHFAQIISIKK